jgi:hypothetical protein
LVNGLLDQLAELGALLGRQATPLHQVADDRGHRPLAEGVGDVRQPAAEQLITIDLGSEGVGD